MVKKINYLAEQRFSLAMMEQLKLAKILVEILIKD